MTYRDKKIKEIKNKTFSGMTYRDKKIKEIKNKK